MDAYVALISLLGLLGLWIVVYYLWPDFRNDSFREDIFSVRDELFRYAAQGNVPFDHPAYTLLRSLMNALLRHGHDMTLSRLLLLIATCKDAKCEAFAEWRAALDQLPFEAQVALNDFNVRTSIFVLQHVIYRSLFRYLAIRPWMLFIHIRVITQSPRVTSSVEQLESATLVQDEALRLPVTA